MIMFAAVGYGITSIRGMVSYGIVSHGVSLMMWRIEDNGADDVHNFQQKSSQWISIQLARFFT